MILVRTGPRFLFLRNSDREQLLSLLEKEYSSERKPLDQAIEESGEGDTILFVLEKDEEKEQVNGKTPVLLSDIGSSPLLISIINNQHLQESIEKAELGPGLLVMKAPPPGDKVLEKVRLEYDALSTALQEAIIKGHSSWSVLCFTDRPLSRSLSTSDLLDNTLLIKKSVPELYQELRRQAVKYLTEELEEGEWRELKINIYDSMERYNINYERVTTVIEDLEIGFILGETWSVDHPFVLMSVPVFQVRLFTYMSPKEVKRIMMSLEYDDQGHRVADLDLYFQNKKVEWGGVEKGRKTSRKDIALAYKDKYMPTLTAYARDKLARLDQALRDCEQKENCEEEKR